MGVARKLMGLEINAWSKNLDGISIDKELHAIKESAERGLRNHNQAPPLRDPYRAAESLRITSARIYGKSSPR